MFPRFRLEVTGGSGGVSYGGSVYEWDSTGETLGDGVGTLLAATESWVWIQVTAGEWDEDGIVSTDSGSFTSGLTYSTVTEATGLDLSLSFDGLERVTGVDWSSAGRTLDHYDYQYDASGNRTVRGNPERSTSAGTYTFDALNRVTADNRFSGQNQSWHLDVQGNMLAVWSDANHDGVVGENESPQTRTFTAGNRIDTVTEGETTWHAGYDAAGNMTFDGTNHFVYDAWNQLVGVKADVVNGSQHTAGAVIATYQYDGRGWRTAKTVAGAGRTDYYYNESWQVVEERTGSAGSVATTTDVQYVWDQSYIDTPVCRFRGGVSSTWETLYYTTDGNHNVVGLVDGATGLPVEQYYYDAYGRATVCGPDPNPVHNWPPVEGNQSQYGNEVMFAGYMYNAESGTYKLRERDLDVPLSVMLEVDEAKDGPNLEAYCHNNPVSGTDPSGLCEDGYLPAGLVMDDASLSRTIADAMPPPAYYDNAAGILAGYEIAMRACGSELSGRDFALSIMGGPAKPPGWYGLPPMAHRNSDGSVSFFMGVTQMFVTDHLNDRERDRIVFHNNAVLTEVMDNLGVPEAARMGKVIGMKPGDYQEMYGFSLVHIKGEPSPDLALCEMPGAFLQWRRDVIGRTSEFIGRRIEDHGDNWFMAANQGAAYASGQLLGFTGGLEGNYGVDLASERLLDKDEAQLRAVLGWTQTGLFVGSAAIGTQWRVPKAATAAAGVTRAATIGERIEGVAQRAFDYAVDNPRVPGLLRMDLGTDAHIQATRWVRRWAERNNVTMGAGGLEFEPTGGHSFPDIVYHPSRQTFDFKLSPASLRPSQTANILNDFPGYSLRYIYGPDLWR